ncbi:hypothetical protein Bbelb_399050 [Branchiostoma belcheri]|nr:hypothetical protein Bbelb_399050 [Branchiostoma belcheri]
MRTDTGNRTIANRWTKAEEATRRKKILFAALREGVLNEQSMPVVKWQKLTGKLVSFGLAVPAAMLHCREMFKLSDWQVKGTGVRIAGSGLNGAVRPQRRKAGCSSEITGQGKNRKVKEAEALMQALMSIEERVHSKRAAVVDAHVDNTNVISAGDNQGGKSLQLTRAVRRLWETVSQRSGCPASRLTKASDVMLHRKVFQWIDAELGGVSGFDTDLMVSPSSVQSARDGRNLRFLRPYPTPYSEGVNVFAQDLTGRNCCAFPPFSLSITALVNFVMQQKARVVLVVPDRFPKCYWLPIVERVRVACAG